MNKLYAIKGEKLNGVFTKQEFDRLEFDKKGLSIRVFNENELNDAIQWSKGKKLKSKKNSHKKNKDYLKNRLFAVRTDGFKGVYTYDEYMEKNLNTQNLSRRTFSKKEMDMAIAWTQGICTSSSLREKNKDNIELKNFQKKLKGLYELRSLLNDKDIVTGYYEDCINTEFTSKVSFFPCPWDSRVMIGGKRPVDCGCYYKCGKHNKKILENKDIYLRSIDKLISLLENDHKWGKEFEYREGIITDADKKHLELWDKKEQQIRDAEFKKRQELREKNEVFFKGGCPVELFADLKKLRQIGAISEDSDMFWEFYDDKFIYIEWYDGLEEKIEHTKDNAALIMEFNPDKPEDGLDLMLGGGCFCSVKTVWNENTSQAISSFYFKWKQYRKDNPTKYIKYR